MGRQKREVFDELHGNGEAIYSGGKETELGSCQVVVVVVLVVLKWLGNMHAFAGRDVG